MNLWRPLTALALAASSALLLPATPASAACNVTVASFSFTPSTLTVTPGTTVTWCWSDAGHSVTSDTPGAFDSNPACPPTCGEQGKTFTHTFTTTSGSPFTYYCRAHKSSMTGSIVVRSPSPTPTKTTRPPTTPPATRTPTPARTTTAPPTTRPPTTPATTAPPTTVPPTTTAPPTTPPATPTPSETPAVVLDPAPTKPKTGLAIGIGIAVAVLAFGGAAAVWLRGRSAR